MNEEKTIQEDPLFRTHKTVSVEEIMAAGGPTEYGKKTGKTSQALREAMKNPPPRRAGYMGRNVGFIAVVKR